MILAVAILAAASIIYHTFRNGISPMPSSKIVRDEIAKMVAGEKQVYELGCGFGHLAFAIAKKNPQCEVIAIENSLIPYLCAALLRKMSRVSNMRVIYGDFWQLDFAEIETIVTYQYRAGVQKLYTKMQNETQFGVKFITNTFAIKNLSPISKIITNDLSNSTIYYYNIYSRH